MISSWEPSFRKPSKLPNSNLKSEVKKFLKELVIKYLEVLEKVFEDYRVQETGQHLQETHQAFSTAGRIARKVAHEQDTKPAPTKLPPILFRFLRNSDNKIPSEIYTKVREWFKRAIKPEADKSDADKDFLSSFSFKMPWSRKQQDVPPHKGPRSGSKYDDYSHRSHRGGYCSLSPSFQRDYHNHHYEHDDPRRSSRRGVAYRDRSRSPEPGPQHDQPSQSGDRRSRRSYFSPHGTSRGRYAWDKGLVNLVRMSKRRMHRIGDSVMCKDENIIITDSGCDQSIINLNSFLISFTGVYYNVGGALQGMSSKDLEIVSDAFTLCTLPDDSKVFSNLTSASSTLIHCKQKRFFSHTRHELMVFWLMIAQNDILPSQADLVPYHRVYSGWIWQIWHVFWWLENLLSRLEANPFWSRQVSYLRDYFFTFVFFAASPSHQT